MLGIAMSHQWSRGVSHTDHTSFVCAGCAVGIHYKWQRGQHVRAGLQRRHVALGFNNAFLRKLTAHHRIIPCSFLRV
jgi:hypothetical protein